MSKQQLKALFRSVPYLTELDEEAITSLASVATPARYSAGEVIFVEGEPCAGLHLIAQGSVKISRFSQAGREHILHLLEEGDTFNDIASLDGGANPVTATAQTDVLIWRITRVNLRETADLYPKLAWALVESAARRARFLANRVQDLSMRNVRGRLARLLLEQATSNDDLDVPRVLTQEEMASYLGTVREVIGRSLRGLAAEGIIEFDRHHIVILDEEQLAIEAQV